MTQILTRLSGGRNKISRISWGAILAGTLTALTISFLLNLLGLGIGLTTIDPLTETDPMAGLGTATIIWWIVSNLVALFAGGMVAGRTSGLPTKTDGGLHGFLAWALYAVITFFMLTNTIGSTINGFSNVASSIFGGGNDGTTQAQQAQMEETEQNSRETINITYEEIKEQLLDIVRRAENVGLVPDSTSQEVKEITTEVSTIAEDIDLNQFRNDLEFNFDQNGNLNITLSGKDNFLNREDLTEYLANNTDLTETEISNTIEDWEAKVEAAVNKAEELYAQTRQKVVKITDKAAGAVGTYSIIIFCILLVGALAGFFGGAAGSPVLTLTEEHDEDRVKDIIEDERNERF